MHATFAASARFIGALLFCGATFAATITVSPVPVHGTVTTDVGGINCGTGGSACASSDIGANTAVTMTAIPDAGYHFVQWQPPFGLNPNPLTFPMPSGGLIGTALFSLTDVNVTSVFPTPKTLAVGVGATLKVTVNPAPVVDTVVSLDAQPSGLVSVPATVTVPAGSTFAAFTATGVSSGTATLTATLGASFQTGSILVIPTALVPDAPQFVSAFPSYQQAQVNFAQPVSDGGSTITSYTVTSSPDNVAVTVPADPDAPGPAPVTVTGLRDGITYTFTVTATNAVGTSAPSSPSNAVVMPVPTAPSEPVNCNAAVSGALRITVTCDPPLSNGNVAINSYTATSSPGGLTASAATPSIDVSGLTAGVTYTFTMTATNSVGTGPASLATPSVVAIGLPGAPTGVTAVGGLGTITVNWTPPADDGGGGGAGVGITKYTVYLSGQGTDVPAPGTSYVLQNAPPGVPVSFTVTATNAAGEGPASAPSNTATATALPPGAPTAVHAMAGPGRATVSFVAPASDGGAAITSYVVTASPGGQTASAVRSPIDVDGLINGSSYTFTVAAQNIGGTGASSGASNIVTPNALGPRLSPYAYITCSADNLVAVIDTSASRVITTIRVGTTPLGVAVNSAGTRVYVANNGAGTISVIDTTTNSVVATIPTSSSPYGIAVNPAGTRVYVTDPLNHVVSIIDALTNLPVGSINLATAVQNAPFGVAVHPSGSAVYVADNAASMVIRIDAATNGLTVIPLLAPVTLAFAPGGGTLYATSALGLSAIVSSTVTANTALSDAAYAVAVNPVTGRQYVSLPAVGRVVAVDGGVIAASIPVGTTPLGVAVTPTGSRVFVANRDDGTVSVINTSNNTVTAAIPVCQQPQTFGAFVGPLPATVPDAPPTVVATAGNAQASVAFVSPSNDGGSPIISYTATSSPGGISATGSTSPIVVAGLTNGTAYTFTVTATNAVGTSLPSPPSNSVTPGTLPGAPTNVSALAGDARATISFSAPASDGGFPITSYGVLCTPGPVTASGGASPVIVTGLTNSTAYSCTVTATNSAGTGPASAPVGLTPLATSTTVLSASPTSANPGATVTLTATVTGAAGTATGSITFSEGATSLGTVPLSAGQAQLAMSSFAIGSHSITATYGGSAAYFPSSSGAVTVTVANPDPPRLGAISTRMGVLTGDNVTIAGFIVGGSTPKTVVVRARGPSLGIAGALANPTLTLVPADGSPPTVNDDWGQASNAAQLAATGLQPANDKESAIMATLNPGAYTAIVSGVGATTGVGIVEVYEVDHPDVPMIAISTRGLVQSGDGVMIGGFIIQGTAPRTVVVRARGPSLGVAGAIADPTLTIVPGDGSAPLMNDDWQSAANAADLEASGMQPANPKESALLLTLNPGAYTAIVSGAGGRTGVAIVEVYAQ